MEYYSAVKRNELLIHTIVHINLENIILSKKTHTKKPTYCMIPFI